MYFCVHVGLQPPEHHPHPVALYIFKKAQLRRLPLQPDKSFLHSRLVLTTRWFEGKSCQKSGKSYTQKTSVIACLAA